MKTANKEATAMKSWQKLSVAITHPNSHCEIPRNSVESWQNKQSAVSLENKQSAVSLVIHKTLCHTERSEVSQVASNRDISLALNMTAKKSLNMTKYPNVQNSLDISVSTKPQYDKAKVSIRQYDKVDSIASECKPISSPSTYEGQSVISPSLSTSGDSTYSPSLAEGVRGWVNPTSAYQAKLATANKHDTSSLRANEVSVAIQNQTRLTQKIDCHEFDKSNSRNDERLTHPQTPSAREGAFKVALHAHNNEKLTRNDEKYCHTERSEVSKKQNRDISLALNMTTRKSLNMTKKTTTPTSRKIALSLLTASALATSSLDILAAGDCVILQHSSAQGATSKRVECRGSFSASEFQSKLETAGKSAQSGLFFIGTSGGGTSIGAGSVSINLGSIGTAQYDYSFQFYGLNAPNTTFTFTGTHTDKPLGILMPYSEAGGSHGANGSTLFGLTLDTDVNYSSYGVANVYGKALGLSIHGGTQIGRVDDRSGEYQGGLTINSGKTVNAMAIYGGFAGTDRSTFVSRITNNGTINELNLGWKEYAEDFASVLGLYNISGNGTITTLNVYQATLTINSNPSTWNNHTHSTNKYPEHISAATITTVGEVGPGAIRINIGEGVTDANNTYLYEKLIIDSTGGKEIGTNGSKHKPNFSHLSAGLGTALHDMGNGFRVSPDIATSYGSSMWRLLTLSYARRSIMVQNIIDTMTTKTFHSDRYYNQEVELRLLQYDMSRLTNRSSKFAKQTRKNQKKVDKMRDKLAKLTLEQSKGQNLDKGYNNFELIDQLDAIFIPYTGRRDWRVFLVPYAAHSYAELGIADATEWAGGGVAGVQRNLKGQGILSTYLTYEYAHATTEMLSAEAIMQTNSLQGGVSYFKIFPITGKVWEATLKASGRVGVDMPLLSAQSPVPNIKFNLVSNKKGLDTPLMWSLGAEVRGGLTFYQFKQNSYVSPEIGLSYDVLSPLDMKLEKAKYQLGGNEYYPSQYWHLPQLSASVKYYKVYGNMFRTNLVAGLRYNMLNTPTAKFKIGGLSGEGKIALPAVYGYLDLDLIWVVKKNHELSAGYNGVFYANKFGKDVMDKFNGVSTSINFKYAHWFGGTDYVKDADGNAISRSVAEGKSKKSKKSKSKKSKKSKKKVYYIDG